MNVWAEKSIKVASSSGYLDKLSTVYSAVPTSDRPLDDGTRQRIRQLRRQRKGLELLKVLLEVKRKGHPFPFEHPYISLLDRKKPNLFAKNPGIAQQIGQILLSTKAEDIIRGCERPADLNRVMGSMFRNWLRSYFPQQGYPVLPESQFEAHSGIAVLDAANARVREYANIKLGCDLTGGKDFLIKVSRGKFVVGEARFFSTAGGSQSRDLDNTLEFAKSKVGNAVRVAVLDGIMWFHKGYLYKISMLKEDEYALTALLLKEFLESLWQRHARRVV